MKGERTGRSRTALLLNDRYASVEASGCANPRSHSTSRRSAMLARLFQVLVTCTPRAARTVSKRSSNRAAPQRESVRLEAPRLARVARRWVAGSGRNLIAGPVRTPYSSYCLTVEFLASLHMQQVSRSAFDRALTQRRPALAGLLLVPVKQRLRREPVPSSHARSPFEA